MSWCLALTVLATLDDDRLRYQVITDARGIIAKGNESGPWALTERAGRVVDRTCVKQAFSFRARPILISMAVGDQAFDTRQGR
jgi:hypothetical protein